MVRSGVVFYAFFGLGWLLAGLGHFGSTTAGVAGVLGLAVALALVLVARRQSAQLSDDVSPPMPPEKRRYFGLVNAVQWTLIVAIAAGCSAAGVPELTMPLVAVVVGLHFLPLARLFGDVRLVAPGAVMTVLGITGLLARAASVSPGTVFTLVGVGCALTLWATAIWSLAGAAQAARQVIN